MEPTVTRFRRFSSRHPKLALAGAAAAVVALVAPALAARPHIRKPPAAKVRSAARALLPLVAPQATGQAPAQIVIGGANRSRFAVPDCLPRLGDELSSEACRTITQVLRADLKFEDLVNFVPESLMTAIPPLNPEAPNFQDWEGIGSTHLIVTRAEVTKGELTLELRVHFVGTGEAMLTKRYSGKADDPRRFAHQASDDIFAFTQYKGVARSKIAFVSDRDQPKDRKAKEIYIVDYDGFNPRRVTVNGSLNILPNWSPDGRTLAYTSYRQGTPAVFLAWVFEARNTKLTSDRGQAFAPSFSPDGKRIAYASSLGGNMDIWVSNIDGSDARRITSGPASDTAPCWSPTGQEIAFTSNRQGTPQIYVMDAEGLNIRRLTRIGNYNDAPAWSPSKENSEIAYTARLEAGGFDIAVVDIASGQIRQITQGRGSCESPSWAPNGRHLAFACSRAGTWQLAVSDREGRAIRTLATGSGNNVQPDWGS